MGGIFICYRREDTAPYARLLSESLAARFGRAEIYRDLDSMAPGVDFPKAVGRALQTCDVLLALIGPRWMDVTDGGVRRLDNSDDYVRVEIAAALAREDVLVIPVLIESTRMPSRAELPAPLAGLADRHAHRLADEGWDDDLRRLVEALEKVVQGRARAPEAVPTTEERRTGWWRGRRRVIIPAGVLVALLVVAAAVVFAIRPDPDDGVDEASNVVACSFGQIRISGGPVERFDRGFTLTIRIESLPPPTAITVPVRRAVSVIDERGAVLNVGPPGTWEDVFPVDVPAGAAFERSLSVRGLSQDIPRRGDRVSVRVVGVDGPGATPTCTLVVDGVPVP